MFSVLLTMDEDIHLLSIQSDMSSIYCPSGQGLVIEQLDSPSEEESIVGRDRINNLAVTHRVTSSTII